MDASGFSIALNNLHIFTRLNRKVNQKAMIRCDDHKHGFNWYGFWPLMGFLKAKCQKEKKNMSFCVGDFLKRKIITIQTPALAQSIYIYTYILYAVKCTVYCIKDKSHAWLLTLLSWLLVPYEMVTNARDIQLQCSSTYSFWNGQVLICVVTQF